MKNVEELTELVQGCSNVESIEYSKKSGSWTIKYGKGRPDTMETEELIEFLETEDNDGYED